MKGLLSARRMHAWKKATPWIQTSGLGPISKEDFLEKMVALARSCKHNKAIKESLEENRGRKERKEQNGGGRKKRAGTEVGGAGGLGMNGWRPGVGDLGKRGGARVCFGEG